MFWNGGPLGSYLKYWGKARIDGQARSFHLLAFHALDVAAVAAELLERDRGLLLRLAALSSFTPESLRRVLPYLLALHDLGKFGEPFQDLEPELVAHLQGARPPRAYALRHDALGYLLWRSWAGLRPDPREVGLLEALHALKIQGEPASARDLGDLMQSWMAAVLGHHGKPPEESQLGPDTFSRSPFARSREDAASFARAAAALLSPGALESSLDADALLERMKRSSWWLAGFAILCDWIGSNTESFPYQSTEASLHDYWAVARAAACRAVTRSGLAGGSPRAYRGMADLFPKIAGQPTPLQKTASEVALDEGPQLFVLEDLTGSGKTEAALVLAHRLMSAGKAEGLFFALPTMATANAMHARVRPLLDQLFEGKPSYILAHSGPHLTEEDRLAIAGRTRGDTHGGAEEPPASCVASDWLADARKKALLADLGVGTIDQALLAALQSKHAALRLLGLHRHVLVVDEVHACDAYMLEVLCALLEMHSALGGSAILLSATLPLEQRCKLARAFARGLGERNPRIPSSGAYPLLTGFSAGRMLELPVAPRAGLPRTLDVRWHTSVESAAGRVVSAAAAGQCACWIRNSVADALEAYEAAVARLGRDAVTLFHARFALGDRLRIERRVVERFGLAGEAKDRSGHVVIATQVVEQSLDIDFDVMVTDVCPIDLLIQRAGRLQRHAERHPGRPAPVLEILAPKWSEEPPPGWLGVPFQRTARVYDDPGVLWRTIRELRQRGGLALPTDARGLVEAVYAGEEVPASLERRSNAALGGEMAHASVARNVVSKLDLGYLRVGADWSSEARTPTRLGEPTTTVRLARVDGRGAGPWFADVQPRLRWPLSQVSVARRLVAKAAPGDEALRRELEEDQPFLGDDVVTVLLREQGEGVWSGEAVAERTVGGTAGAVSVRVSYSAEHGLGVSERG